MLPNSDERCSPAVACLAGLLIWLVAPGLSQGDAPPWIQVENRGFVTSAARPFHPWGFNYDHDDKGRLLEDYWDAEWPKVEEDFRAMRALGANVVRIHLQLAKFLTDRQTPNGNSLDRLSKLLKLAEKNHLYLDLTGLGCYHKKDVPPWYDLLSESDRWEVQAVFWAAIARLCRESPAVFCYDLMNEPVVPGGARKPGDWLGPAFGGKHFVQFITLDQAERSRPAIARAWIQHLTRAIRAHDRRHLITVGLVDWSLDRPGQTSGLDPAKIATDLDFLCVHLYPEAGRVDEALRTLDGFAKTGKPVLIEETFPLKCGMADFDRFATGATQRSAGLIGFYWGKSPESLRQSKSIADAITLQWLEWFRHRRLRANE